MQELMVSCPSAETLLLTLSMVVPRLAESPIRHMRMPAPSSVPMAQAIPAVRQTNCTTSPRQAVLMLIACVSRAIQHQLCLTQRQQDRSTLSRELQRKEWSSFLARRNGSLRHLHMAKSAPCKSPTVVVIVWQHRTIIAPTTGCSRRRSPITT